MKTKQKSTETGKKENHCFNVIIIFSNLGHFKENVRNLFLSLNLYYSARIVIEKSSDVTSPRLHVSPHLCALTRHRVSPILQVISYNFSLYEFRSSRPPFFSTTFFTYKNNHLINSFIFKVQRTCKSDDFFSPRKPFILRIV